MSLRDDDDDTSAGRMTQGGSRDGESPGPHRRAGNSFWWFAIALVVAAVLVVAWLSTVSPTNAPAERGTIPMSGGVSGAGGSGTAATPVGQPPSVPSASP